LLKVIDITLESKLSEFQQKTDVNPGPCLPFEVRAKAVVFWHSEWHELA